MESGEGGRAGLARTLLFLDAPTVGEERLRELLEGGDVSSPLSALLREAGVAPSQLAKRVADAKMAFEREVARADAVGSMPDLIADLKRHALDGPRKCPRCYGVKGKGMNGKTVVRLGEQEDICPECEGSGLTVQSSAHKQWAATHLSKIASLPEERGPGVQVNVQNNVATPSGGVGYMEKLAKAVHRVMAAPTHIVDAEVVKDPSPSTPSES